jgi:hypothetical protein
MSFTMASDVSISPVARYGLALVAGVGALGINTVFLAGAWQHPAWIRDALTNPVSAAFIVEPLLVVGVLAWLLPRARITRITPFAFVVMSLIGSLAFSLPVAILMPPLPVERG